MERFYREMFEETASLKSELVNVRTERKDFGKLTVFSGDNPKTNASFVTITNGKDLFCDSNQKNNLKKEISSSLKKFFEKYSLNERSKIMVVGLGNEKVTADSLGCRVIDKLTVTGHLYDDEGVRNKFGNLCAIKCGVPGTTGIESFCIIKSVVSSIKPDIIVAVDTLSCGKTERLGRTVQLTDNGIEPGGGVNNPKRKLSSSSLKTPVVALGVPFVIYVSNILSEYGVKAKSELSALVVTAKEIDFLIEDYSYVIASAIDETVHSISNY